MHKALKDFPLSRDGFRSEDIKSGDPVDVPARLVSGLTEEGFIAAIEPEVETPEQAATETAVEREIETPGEDEIETKPRRKRKAEK